MWICMVKMVKMLLDALPRSLVNLFLATKFQMFAKCRVPGFAATRNLVDASLFIGLGVLKRGKELKNKDIN
jgi:hypothetical protein